VMYFTASFPGMRTNYPRGNVFQLYGAGISGILFIMLLGKLIQHLPVINYLGRYSLVTLGIHGPILHFISPLIARYITNEYMFFVVALLVTLSLCLAFTPLILKLFPHLVAQKELITYHPAEH
jgi:fucose 4-O-acetylase-like acetyltransferase